MSLTQGNRYKKGSGGDDLSVSAFSAASSPGWPTLCLPIAMGRCPEGAVGHLVLQDAEL